VPICKFFSRKFKKNSAYARDIAFELICLKK
jgi:hypothetical protein